VVSPRSSERQYIYLVDKFGMERNVDWGTENWRWKEYVGKIGNSCFLVFLFGLGTYESVTSLTLRMRQIIRKIENAKR